MQVRGITGLTTTTLRLTTTFRLTSTFLVARNRRLVASTSTLRAAASTASSATAASPSAAPPSATSLCTTVLTRHTLTFLHTLTSANLKQRRRTLMTLTKVRSDVRQAPEPACRGGVGAGQPLDDRGGALGRPNARHRRRQVRSGVGVHVGRGDGGHGGSVGRYGGGEEDEAGHGHDEKVLERRHDGRR
eukprot:TRINITY_DN313_c0_g1_i1.p1 TRINITY_DN313_c0_g1~~TRINITY_DN313_c0_g1_i1.p1  ORF type:complete len:189 (+),score=20.21 TRINITY_DN313_c0_g1_i1:524-1090(+)